MYHICHIRLVFIMLTPLSIIHNLSFIQCVQSIIDDRSLDTNIVLFVENKNKINVPVITTGLDDFKKSTLFKHLDENRLSTSKHIFSSSHKDMSTKNMRHFSELKKDTIFANVSSGEITVGQFEKYEVKSVLVGSCSNPTSLNESIATWVKNRRKWRYSTTTVCYTFDPPFTMNHLSLSRKGMVVDIHEMIHELIGIKPIFRKMNYLGKDRKRSALKRLQSMMRGRVCDYFLQGINGHMKYEYDFTTPCFSDTLFWYAPTADLVPKWKYVYQILSREVWYSWVSTILALFLMWYLSTLILGRFTHGNKLWTLYKLAVEQDVHIRPNNLTEVIVITALIVESLIMNVAYKCKFVQFLSDDNYENQLNSLEDVMEQDLKIGFLPLLADTFKQDEELTNYLKDHYVPCDFSFSCIDRTANSKDMIVLRTKSKVSYFSRRYVDASGRFKLKRIGGVVNTMTFNAIFRRGHPLYPLVERELLNLLAHGFVQRITKSYFVFGEVTEDPPSKRKLTLKHLRLAFLILMLGWMGAGVLFVFEIFSSRYFELHNRKFLYFHWISNRVNGILHH